jgi:hypothetical protein
LCVDCGQTIDWHETIRQHATSFSILSYQSAQRPAQNAPRWSKSMTKPRISYVDPATIKDPAMQAADYWARTNPKIQAAE